jgi:hypothetical protein
MENEEGFVEPSLAANEEDRRRSSTNQAASEAPGGTRSSGEEEVSRLASGAAAAAVRRRGGMEAGTARGSCGGLRSGGLVAGGVESALNDTVLGLRMGFPWQLAAKRSATGPETLCRVPWIRHSAKSM